MLYVKSIQVVLAIIVGDRKERRLKLQLQLHNVDHCSHDKPMLIQRMAKGLIEGSKGLEFTIHCLVASSNPSLLSFKGSRDMLAWSTSMSVAVAIASICHIHLTWKKRVIQPVAGNLSVRPAATRKRSHEPNKVPPTPSNRKEPSKQQWPTWTCTLTTTMDFLLETKLCTALCRQSPTHLVLFPHGQFVSLTKRDRVHFSVDTRFSDKSILPTIVSNQSWPLGPNFQTPTCTVSIA